MQMIDNGEVDHKIIAVAAKDPSVNHYHNIEDLARSFPAGIKEFL